MTKTIYIPTLNTYQKYEKPYYKAIQYTGSEDIIKALHGFIENIVACGHINILDNFDNNMNNPNMKEYYEELNILKDDSDAILIQKLCNFVKSEDDFDILIRMFGLEYYDYEVSSWFSIEEIELV